MKTKLSSILIVVFCTFLISFAQILYKIGSKDLCLDFNAIISNTPIILGLTLYLIGALLLVIALKKGELSILYPFLALSYVWVSLLSTRYLPVPEKMNFYKWLGVFIIIIGVTFIGIGSKSENN